MTERTAEERPSRRIALLIESDHIGGAEVMVYRLGCELRDRGHEVTLVVPANRTGWLGERFRSSGMQSRTFDLKRTVDPAGARALGDLLASERIEILHSHMFIMAVYGAAAARRAGARHIITMHGDGNDTRFLRRRLALRWAFGRSDAVVAVSAAMRSDLIAKLGRRFEQHIGVVPNGVPDVPGDRDALRRELGISEDERIILALGTVIPRKNHVAMLLAAAQLPKDIPWRVVIGGSWHESKPDVDRVIAEHGLQDRVSLLGPRNDVENLLEAADVFMMPSLWEGLPMAMLEAMFRAKPIVAARVGGIPEAVEHGVDALLCEPEDIPGYTAALREILSNPARAAALGAGARRRALAGYSVDAMTDSYLALYER